MRSSRSKPTKSVSICSEPVTENGPCTKKETMDREEMQECNGVHRKEEVRAVASRVVQDVVRMASETALERVTASVEEIPAEESSLNSEKPSPSHSEQEDSSLQRLPKIQIETVPSMPSSPTEWPSPPPEATIPEETQEDLDQEEIQLNFEEEETDPEEEARKFASTYLEDLFEKAVETANERQRAQDLEAAREIAAQVIEDIIYKASETAADRSTSGLTFPDQNESHESLPEIQIDTVESLPPSPSSMEENETNRKENEASEQMEETKQNIPEITYTHPEEDKEIECEKLVPKIKFDDAPEDVRNFASSYIKDIIARAVTTAEEKNVSSTPFSFEDVDLMKVNGPWYIRARETFIRFLRSACFCTPRRNSS